MGARVGFVTLLMVLVGTGASAQGPIPVSPGAQSGLATVSDRCPTFHWTAVGGVESLDLVVYRLSQGGDSMPPERVLAVTLPGSANGWTPALGQCLERGGRYAWSVGVEGAWSEASLFEISTAPSVVEVEEALAVLARYLVTRREARADRVAGAAVELEPASGREAPTSSPAPALPGPTLFSVAGGVEAAFFVGDGSSVTNLDPVELLPGTAAIDIAGNAASATNADTLDGLDSVVFLQKIELDTEAELEARLTDVVNVLTDDETAATANALIMDGADCPPGQWSAGVDAAGNAQGCTVDGGIDHGFGTGNTRVGSQALASNTSGYGNTAIGASALEDNTTGFGNTASGFGALEKSTDGYNNTATGVSALGSNTTGFRNTASGAGALGSNTSGLANTATGYDALATNTIGNSNTATGADSLVSNTSGFFLTATGAAALATNTTGASNTATGVSALFSNTTASYNTATGASALQANTTGSGNTANGYKTLWYNVDGASNTAIGAFALYNSTEARNVAIGHSAGKDVVYGSDNILISNLGMEREFATIRIGTQGTQTKAYIAGIYGTAVSGSAVAVDSSGQLAAAYAISLNPLSTAPSCDDGTVYYDSDDADFCVCKGSTWFFMDGTATTSGECGTP